MSRISSVHDYGTEFCFQPPLTVEEGFAGVRLEEAVGSHIANRRDRPGFARFATEQVLAVSRAAQNNAERADMLSTLIDDGTVISLRG